MYGELNPELTRESTYSTTQLCSQLHARNLKMTVPGARKEVLPQVKVPVTKPDGHRSVPGAHMVESEVQPMPVVLSPPHVYAEWFGSLVWFWGFGGIFVCFLRYRGLTPRFHIWPSRCCAQGCIL